MRRIVRRIVFTLAGVILLFDVATGYIEGQVATHPPVAGYVWPRGGYPGVARPQEIAFISRTGVRIVGRFFPGRERAAIILTHGYGVNQQQMLPWAAFLHRAGYSVLTYDLRGHGRSGRAAVTFGALEQYDLMSAVDYLAARPDVDPARIGALGLSLGGAVTILAAARDPRIRAVVDDSGYSDVRAVVGSAARHFLCAPDILVSPLAVPFAAWRAGVDVGAARPVDAIGAISPRPVFIIHGFADDIVSPANSMRNYDAARRPKELWFVYGARHGRARLIAGPLYERRVVAFFRRALGA